jgi:hypothetical protein
MPARHQDNDQQVELPLSSVMSHAVFPGRRSLLVAEIAETLRCTEQHVLNLCELGNLIAIDIRTGREAKPSEYAKSRSARRCLRIPVSSYDAFVQTRTT